MTTNLLDAIGCPRVKQRERPSSVLYETMGRGGTLPPFSWPDAPSPSLLSSQCQSVWQGHRVPVRWQPCV